MRKLLLASAAMLGGTMALVSVASAQVAQNYSGVTGGSPPYPNFAQPGPTPLGALPISSPNFGTAVPGLAPPLAPGNISVRLVGRMYAYFGFASDSGRNATVTPVNAGATSTNGVSLSPQANTKLQPLGAFEFSRLYPSFDAVAANGLKYGAFLEIRQDNSAPPGGGANGSVSGSDRSRAQLYFRRETTYIGTDQLGQLRFGGTDQPSSLMLTGNFENFDDGGWNGDPALITGNAEITWPFSDVGAYYSTTKIVYMSPKFADLIDFGVSYEPGTGTNGEDSTPGNCPYGVTANNGLVGPLVSGGSEGCDSAAATTIASEAGRRRNTFDAVVRLRTAIGPVGVAFTVGGIEGGHVLYDGAVSPTVVRYNGLSLIDSGLQVTYGGLAVGGHIIYGRGDNAGGNWALQPVGAVNEMGALIGASYTMGSNVIGFHMIDYTSAGSWNQTLQYQSNGNNVGKTRLEQGIAVGDTFTLAPGAYLMLTYLYGTRHQNGVDLLSGATSGTTYGKVVTNNNVRAQAIMIGTMFRW